jgi:hypothetical protein
MSKPAKGIKEFIPGESLYLAVRGGFIIQGTTFTKWCKQNSIHPTSARLALLGGWSGPKGKELRARLVNASSIDPRKYRAA